MIEPSENPVQHLAEYDRRHMVAHLETSSRSAELHRLLGLEWVRSRETVSVPQPGQSSPLDMFLREGEDEPEAHPIVPGSRQGEAAGMLLPRQDMVEEPPISSSEVWTNEHPRRRPWVAAAGTSVWRVDALQILAPAHGADDVTARAALVSAHICGCIFASGVLHPSHHTRPDWNTTDFRTAHCTVSRLSLPHISSPLFLLGQSG